MLCLLILILNVIASINYTQWMTQIYPQATGKKLHVVAQYAAQSKPNAHSPMYLPSRKLWTITYIIGVTDLGGFLGRKSILIFRVQVTYQCSPTSASFHLHLVWRDFRSNCWRNSQFWWGKKEKIAPKYTKLPRRYHSSNTILTVAGVLIHEKRKK